MQIIDAHLHFQNWDGFQEVAAAAGHRNTSEHLLRTFADCGVVLGIAMGSGHSEDEREFRLPRPDLAGPTLPDAIAYCAGVDSSALTPERLPAALAAYERELRNPRCVGLKFYMGYQRCYLDDPRHYPLFDLARSCDRPIVMHSGDTANAGGLLKYAHPLTVDDAAVKFPGTRFVIAHYGNPWLVDATAVAAKNPNVYLDLSGLAAGNFEPEWFLTHYHGYLELIRTWLTYLGNYEKVLFGSDWPLVNLPAYLELMRRIIPEKEHEKFFYANALQVFPALQRLLPGT